MLQRTSVQLTPTATAEPATPVPTSSPTPITQSSATPATDLATAYFGRVFLAVVPGKSGAAVPMTRFSVRDQIGLYIDKLDERLHPGFTLRLFDIDSGAMVANVPGETMQRFLDSFVWYHQGFEPVGHYRGELYAGDVLTSVLEYTVVTEPVTIPTTAPTPEPTLAPVAPPAAQAAPAAAPE